MLGALAGAISESESFRLLGSLRKPRKLSTMVLQSSQKNSNFEILPSFAEGHGCKPVDECEVGTLRSLGARPSQPKRLLRRSRQGGCASAFAVRSRLRPTKVGGFRPTKRVERCHGRKAVGLHSAPGACPERSRRVEVVTAAPSVDWLRLTPRTLAAWKGRLRPAG